MDSNTVWARQSGVADSVINQIDRWWEITELSDREKTLFEYADAITFSDRDVDDQLFARLSTWFDTKQIVTLTAIIAFENFRSKFNRALRVESHGFSE